jgi:hypothetical protein
MLKQKCFFCLNRIHSGAFQIYVFILPHPNPLRRRGYKVVNLKYTHSFNVGKVLNFTKVQNCINFEHTRSIFWTVSKSSAPSEAEV